VFDQEGEIMTPVWTNTVDATQPESSVMEVAMATDTTAYVKIEAYDELSKPWKCDLYVQENTDGAWLRKAVNIPVDSMVQMRVEEGASYGFYVVVTDSAGNVEQKEAAREFTFEVFGSQTDTDTQIELAEGWNWISTYIEGDPVELLDMLKESLSENGIQIESQYDGLTENIGDGYWWGDLDEVGIMNESMYLIEVAAECTIELEGTAVDPADHEITLYPEWTWIGFPCTEEVDIVVALSGLEAEEGDMIEGPDGVAEYLGGGFWYGIETFVPGQGYMYFSNSDESKTLVFQTGRSKAKAKAGFFSGKAPKMSVKRKADSQD
jgi:hypothetical protein